MRLLPPTLALLLAFMPALQAYGKTMAEEHCRTRGRIAALAIDGAHDPAHAQHHAATDPASNHHGGAPNADATDAAHCQCGCLCEAICAGGAVLTTSVDVAAPAPSHEPWQAVSDIRHPVSVHDSLLRPPRLS